MPGRDPTSGNIRGAPPGYAVVLHLSDTVVGLNMQMHVTKVQIELLFDHGEGPRKNLTVMVGVLCTICP